MAELTPEREAEIRELPMADRWRDGKPSPHDAAIRDLLISHAALRARLAAVEQENVVLRRQYQDDGVKLAAAERAAAQQAYARGVVEAERDQHATDLVAIRGTLRYLVKQIDAVLPP